MVPNTWARVRGDPPEYADRGLVVAHSRHRGHPVALFGEIADETDNDEALIVAEGDGWWVDARLAVDDLLKVTGVEAADDYEGDTVGGLILALAERVPEEGEVFHFEELELTVTRMQGRRVAEVKVAVTERAETT